MMQLQQDLTHKEAQIAEARLVQLEQQMKATQESEAQVRAAFAMQQTEALTLNSKAAEYAHLEDEVKRTEKQCGDLDSRIKEVMANSQDSGSLKIEVVETARAGEMPTRCV